MAQVNRPRFTSTIINAGWAAATRAAAVSQTARFSTIPQAAPNQAAATQPRTTALVARSPMQSTAIVPRDWSSSTVVVEPVDLPETLDPRLTVLREPTSAQARSYRL